MVRKKNQSTNKGVGGKNVPGVDPPEPPQVNQLRKGNTNAIQQPVLPHRSRGMGEPADRDQAKGQQQKGGTHAGDNQQAITHDDRSPNQPGKPQGAKGNSEITRKGLEAAPKPAEPAEDSKDGFSTVLESTKPASGTAGHALQIKTNHFRCGLSQTRRILRLLLTQLKFTSAATDYAALVVSLKPLTTNDTSEAFTVDLLDEGQITHAQGEATKNWTVVLNPLKALDTQELVESLSSGRGLPSQYTVGSGGGDRFFAANPTKPQDLFNALEAFFGFSRSVRALQNDVFLQLNASASAFYKTCPTLAHLIDDWTPTAGPENPKRKQQIHDRDWIDLEKYIRSLKVQVTYTGRMCSVWGFARASDDPINRPTKDNVRFDWKKEDGTIKKQISVKDYLFQKYQVESEWENALVINVGTGDHPVAVPCDLLKLIPGNVYGRLLKPQQTGKMVKYAARKPGVNQKDIENNGTKMFGVSGQGPDSLADRFSIEVESQMREIKSRMLNSPHLRYLTSTDNKLVEVKRHSVNDQSDSVELELSHDDFLAPKNKNWLLEGRYFPQIGAVPKCCWLEIYSGNKAFADQRDQWLSSMNVGLRQYCSDEKNYATLGPIDTSPSKKNPSHDQLNKALKIAKSKGFNIVFVLLETNDATRYDNLKTIADTEVGIHTICTVQKQGQIKCDMDFVGNEMLKVNLKMGGINTALSMTAPGVDDSVRQLLSGTTMIVGADVTHPGPGSMKDANSIAAVVATYESTFSQYPASLGCQASKEEMIQNLHVMLIDRLVTYSRKNKKAGTPDDEPGPLPTQIIFVRDGVGEGDFGRIASEELPLVERAFKTVYGGRGLQPPKLLFMCVVKRVNTRFYPITDGNTNSYATKRDHIDKNGNAYPGLVVDTAITYPRGMDFYLQSQRAIQGTAKPAHYVVIVDEIGVSADTLQKAVFWQCWTFQRSLTPISVHPAARAADRACARARSYVRKFLVGNESETKMDRNKNAQDAWMGGVHEDLRDTTFYL